MLFNFALEYVIRKGLNLI